MCVFTVHCSGYRYNLAKKQGNYGRKIGWIHEHLRINMTRRRSIKLWDEKFTLNSFDIPYSCTGNDEKLNNWLGKYFETFQHVVIVAWLLTRCALLAHSTKRTFVKRLKIEHSNEWINKYVHAPRVAAELTNLSSWFLLFVVSYFTSSHLLFAVVGRPVFIENAIILGSSFQFACAEKRRESIA